MALFPRLLLLASILLCPACTGGTFIRLPEPPRQVCPTCWDDLYQGSDPPRPR